MPVKPRFAVAGGLLPPDQIPPPRVTTRLLPVITHGTGNTLRIFTERAKTEEGQPRVKIPQLHFTKPYTLDYVRDALVPYLARPPHLLADADYEIIWDATMRPSRMANLPPSVKAHVNADEIEILPVHVRLAHGTGAKPFNAAALQGYCTLEQLLTLCQSYRKKTYLKVLQKLHLFSNVTTLHKH